LNHRPFRNAVRVGLDCLRGMERTVQVLAAHCVLKQSSDIVASPGTMLAPALLTDREQQQQQHILALVSAKATPAQRHARLCSICGAARCTHRRACTHARTHAHTCTHTHVHTHTHEHTHTNLKCARVYTLAHAHTYTCMRTNTQTHSRAHIHPRKHTGTHAHTHTHTRARTHAYACTCCAHDGPRQFFSVASDRPHLSLLHFYCFFIALFSFPSCSQLLKILEKLLDGYVFINQKKSGLEREVCKVS